MSSNDLVMRDDNDNNEPLLEPVANSENMEGEARCPSMPRCCSSRSRP